jgi:Spy/CpxP family protein refolding chaperone
MIRRLTLLALAVLLGMPLFAAAAAADEAWSMGGKDRQLLADLEANAERLGLGADTMTKIRAIVAEGRASGETMRAQLVEAHDALRAMLSAPRPDEATVMAQARHIGELDTKLLELRLQTLLRIRPLLTDAQIEALRASREQRLGQVREACRADIETLCSDAAPGHDTGHCLRAQEASLSEACRTALSTLRSAHPNK